MYIYNYTVFSLVVYYHDYIVRTNGFIMFICSVDESVLNSLHSLSESILVIVKLFDNISICLHISGVKSITITLIQNNRLS